MQGETRKASSQPSQPGRTKAIAQESGDGESLTFNLKYTPRGETRAGDGERLDEGERVPFSMSGMMLVLMQLPSGPAAQTALNHEGWGVEAGIENPWWARKLCKQGRHLLTFGGMTLWKG